MNAVDYFKQHEGVRDYLYLDVYGLVTTGVGFLVATPQDMIKYDWRYPVPNEPWDQHPKASEYDCSAAWMVVHSMPHGVRYGSSTFAPATSIRIGPMEIDSVLADNIAVFEVGLGERWPAYAEFPDGPQLALLDMAYSLGVRGLIQGYPKLGAAVDRKDWHTAAAECHRFGVSDQRNADCAALFVQL